MFFTFLCLIVFSLPGRISIWSGNNDFSGETELAYLNWGNPFSLLVLMGRTDHSTTRITINCYLNDGLQEFHFPFLYLKKWKDPWLIILLFWLFVYLLCSTLMMVPSANSQVSISLQMLCLMIAGFSIQAMHIQTFPTLAWWGVPKWLALGNTMI